MEPHERVKAVYRQGVLELLEPVYLPEGTEVWVELLAASHSNEESNSLSAVCPQPPETLLKLVGLVSVGGDAVADSEALYDTDWY